MAIEKINTSDGVKLRDSRSKTLLGSIGSGAASVPTAAPDRHLPAAQDPAGTPDDAAQAAALEALAARHHRHGVLSKAAADLGCSLAVVKRSLQDWAGADAEEYADVPAPDPAYRYDTDPRLLPDPDADPALARAWRKLGWEHYLAQPHPVFVYGTLRTGQHNHRLMAAAVEDVHGARLSGVAIYGAHFGFPHAAEHADPQAVTVGEVTWLSRDEAGRTARRHLDFLEGFHSDFPDSSHYERVLRTAQVTDPDGTVRDVAAWVYLARGYSRSSLRESDRIADGDWVKAKTEYRAARDRSAGPSTSWRGSDWDD